MDGSAPIAASDDEVLDELTQLGLALARDLQQAALAAESADDKARLAAAFHKVARGVRQGIALKQKLGREAQAFACEADRREVEAVERRKARLWPELQRAVWDEYEEVDDYDMQMVAGVALDEAARRPGFAVAPFATLLAALMDEVRAELGDPGVYAPDDTS